MVELAIHIEREFSDGTRVGPVKLHVNNGELLTILGPSGSGKTTTLRMIAGFIEPDHGSVEFDGIDVTILHPRDREIGMVFQSIALFPHMSVFQNIAFGLELAGVDRASTIERVEYLADLLGIKRLLHRKINEISGGEGQRVALARALANEPKLLLLDEPLSSLDPQLRERLQWEIRRIQRHLDITTIYVTHNQEEAFSISDRIAVMNDGVIVQIGSPEELYDHPKTEFVAHFLGKGNVFRGEVLRIDKSQCIVGLGSQQISINCESSLGGEVVFSVKPEDVLVFLEQRQDSLAAKVVSVVPQIGEHRVIMEFEGQTITALVNDDSLLDQLQTRTLKTVYFSFDPAHVSLISESRNLTENAH